MRKLLCFLVIIMCLFCGCKKEDSIPAWEEADFAFYNFDGREVLFPTIDDYWIDLTDIENIQTYREVRIGDRAITALEKHDLKDFEYSICDLSEIKGYSEKSRELDEFYKKEGCTVNDILNKLGEISAKDLGVELYCDIYKQEGNLCTLSDLEIDEEYETESLGKDDEDNSSFLKEHLKYSISIYIQNEKIHNVYIDSNYHFWLNVATTYMPDWLKELGE